jgi:hypothetical protein
MSRAIVGLREHPCLEQTGHPVAARDEYHVPTRATLSLTAHMILAMSVHQVRADSWLTLESKPQSAPGADLAPDAAPIINGATALRGIVRAQLARDGIVAGTDLEAPPCRSATAGPP